MVNNTIDSMLKMTQFLAAADRVYQEEHKEPNPRPFFTQFSMEPTLEDEWNPTEIHKHWADLLKANDTDFRREATKQAMLRTFDTEIEAAAFYYSMFDALQITARIADMPVYQSESE